MATTTIESENRPRRAILVGLVLPGCPATLVDAHLDELAELARSAGIQVDARAVQQRKAPHPATYIGSGKAQEIANLASEIDLVLFDDDLAPGQVKNLEEILPAAVLDRSGLILEIFSRRARTREARTQVEVAQLEYLLPRLARRWTHLSRQAGGIGVRGGEGETQLEVDRRMLRQRIRRLKKDLVQIERTRDLQRRGRQRISTIALTGYTNAGKSTLFNRLTKSQRPAEDRLFATLDSRLRRGVLSPNQIVLFADTVGFIRKLPHHLVASFRGTLEEAVQADLVLHLIDGSHPAWREQLEVGKEVLADLGVPRERILEVFNKADLTGTGTHNAKGLSISATTGAGIESLKEALAARLGLQPETLASATAHD